MAAVGNGAADLAPARPDTSTVPDHAVLGSFIGFPHSVVLLVDLIVAPFLRFRFASALDASDSMAGTDQNAVQIWPFPLVINGVELTVLYTTILRDRGGVMLRRLSRAPVRPFGHAVHRAPDAQRNQHPGNGAAGHTVQHEPLV